MLIVFHLLSLLLQIYIKNKNKQRALIEFEKIRLAIDHINFSKALATRNAEEDLKFDPPVYKQRYGTVFDVLLEGTWRSKISKVVEYGCAEFGFFLYIKKFIGICEVCFVDIDEDLLTQHLHKVEPLTIEYLRRRPQPFKVNVFAGSITDPDYRILDTDAVIGIEIIEHLYPDVLEAVPYTIFNSVQPMVAIFTTPNAEFNVLFPNFKGFRHYDHKFEWTREQFQSWANNITARFPHYYVTFSGIGNGPKGTDSLGCCSQMAVFVRKDLVNPSYNLQTRNCFCSGDMQNDSKFCSCCYPKESYGICTYFSYAKHFEELNLNSIEQDSKSLSFYKLLQSFEYPYEVDDRTPEQRMLHEVQFKMNFLGNTSGRFFNAEKCRTEIPLMWLTYNLDGHYITISELRTLLSVNQYKIEECIIVEGEGKEECLIYEPDMENSSTSEFDEGSITSYKSVQSRSLINDDTSLSDWDDDRLSIKCESNEFNNKKVITTNTGFPDWLLQMLNANFGGNEDDQFPHDEPHFYCQGDGLGVHPSIIAVDVDNDDDASSESSSSTHGSANLIEVGHENSEQDAVSLPDDSRDLTINTNSSNNSTDLSLTDIVVNNMLPQLKPSNNNVSNNNNTNVIRDDSEEFFDTTDDPTIHSHVTSIK